MSSTVTWRTIPWLKVLRVLGCMCGMAIVALGLYELIMDDPEIKPVIENIYRIIFGFLIIIAELQFVHLLDWFSFLCTLMGLGGFYIFVGGLALGSEWWAIALAVIMVTIGIVYCLSGLGCQDDRPKAVHLKSGGGWADPDAGGHRAAGGESAL